MGLPHAVVVHCSIQEWLWMDSFPLNSMSSDYCNFLSSQYCSLFCLSLDRSCHWGNESVVGLCNDQLTTAQCHFQVKRMKIILESCVCHFGIHSIFQPQTNGQ